MTPAVVSARRHEAAEREVAATVATLMDDAQRARRAAMAQLRKTIEAATVDVGTKFSEVARAIHRGEEPERAIRGQATPTDVRALLEDGVSVAPMPSLPDEAN